MPKTAEIITDEKKPSLERQEEHQNLLSCADIYRILYEVEFTPRPPLTFDGSIKGEQQRRQEEEIIQQYCEILALSGNPEEASEKTAAIRNSTLKAKTFLSLAELLAQTPTHETLVPNILAQAAKATDNLMLTPWVGAGLSLKIAKLQEQLGLDSGETLAKMDKFEEMFLSWGIPSWPRRMERLIVKAESEKLKPETEQSKDKIKRLIKEGCDVFTKLTDFVWLESILPFANYFFQEYAKLYGSHQSLELVPLINFPPLRSAALIGVSTTAATQEDDEQLEKAAQSLIENLGNHDRFGTSFGTIRARYHSALPLLLTRPVMERYAQTLVYLMAGGENDSGFQSSVLTEQAYLAFTYASLAQAQNSIPKTCDFQKKYKETKAQLLEGLAQLKRDGLSSIYDYPHLAYVYKVLTFLGERVRKGFLALVAQASQETNLDWVFQEIALEMTEAGFLAEAFDLSFKINDFRTRLSLQLAILKAHLKKTQEDISGKNITIEDLLKIPPDQEKLISARAFGYSSWLETKAVLDRPDLKDEVKISFLLGRGQRESEEQRKKHHALPAAVRYLRSRPDLPRPLVQLFINGLIETQKYQTVTRHLFALLDHRKKHNYSQVEPSLPYADDVFVGLMRIGNPKGTNMAAQLFANPGYATEHPQRRRRLFDELFKAGYWPPELRKCLEKRSSNEEIDEKYLDFLAFLIAKYNATCTPEMLELIEQENRPFPLEAMKEVTDRLLKYAERYEVPMNPADLAAFLLQDEVGRRAYFIKYVGQSQYAGINNYPYQTFEALLENTVPLSIAPTRYNRLREHLETTGYTQKEIDQIMDSLARGLYPFDEKHWPYETYRRSPQEKFKAVKDIEYERELFLQQLNLLRIRLWALVICQRKNLRASSLPEYESLARKLPEFESVDLAKRIGRPIFDPEVELTPTNIQSILAPQIKEKGGSWRTVFWSQVKILVQDLAKTELFSHLQSEFDLIFDNLEMLERQPIRRGAKKPYLIEVVEKGRDPLRFARAVDGIVQCVSSKYPSAHINYMRRRLVDPCSFTVDITDLETQKIVGCVEMRLGINPETSKMELFCVGIYSAGKNKSFVDQVLRFIEDRIAIPLRLGAVNVANIHGGVIPQALGYLKTDNKSFIAFSPVQTRQGQLIWARGDDIIQDYDYQQHPEVNYNGPFYFKGYRKELNFPL